MAARLPNYYSRLEPFQEAFVSGNPILTYHKLGPRPRGVRLKGLYVGAALFRKQLRELRAAGFANGSLDACVSQPAGKRIVITFDDGYASVLRHGMEVLREQGFRAVLFVVADYIGRSNVWDEAEGEVAELLMDEPQLRDWLGAGHEIGAHTCTHPALTKISPAQAREEIVAGKKKLEDRFGAPVRHFCYPYGDWNPAVLDLVREAGYQTASTTAAGMNHPGESPLLLKRFTARYESRSLKNMLGRARNFLRPGKAG